MNRRAEPFPMMAYIAVPLTLSLIATVTISQIQRRGDDLRDTQRDLARIQAIVYERHMIQSEALAERRLSPLGAAEARRANHQADMAVAHLLGNHPRGILLGRVQTAYHVFDAALSDELDSLVAGNFRSAGDIATGRVEPTYKHLIQSVQGANADFNQQAQREGHETGIAISVLLVGGALCLGAFMGRVARSQRQDAVRAAQRSDDERLRAILESALDAVIGMDTQGSIIAWNRRAEAIFGWTKEEALGWKLIETIVPEPLRDEFRDGLARHICGGEWDLVGRRVEIEALHRTGRLFPIAISLSAVSVDERLTFSAFVSDITEARQVLERLERSEERYRSVVEHVQDVIFTMDTSGRWTYLNPAWTHITGFDAEECVGKQFLAYVSEEDLGHRRQAFEAMQHGQRSCSRFETRFNTRSGKIRWTEVRMQATVDADGRVTGFFGTMCDISERKSAAQRLEHQALHDALTGLPNRLLFQDRLGSAIGRAGRLKAGVAVLVVDLD
ncbi:MAG TPA: GGDEF domain-containing protein, partial [Chthonomonadaceae bacterium]|nr:GGDEF domain-containing protein [Chthonomonadaceae bacterium]